jgi:hypothetical protein
MSDIPFYRTQMGHRFYESTVPSLVHELARLNENLERLLQVVERDAPRSDPPSQRDPSEEPCR